MAAYIKGTVHKTYIFTVKSQFSAYVRLFESRIDLASSMVSDPIFDIYCGQGQGSRSKTSADIGRIINKTYIFDCKVIISWISLSIF